MVKGKTSKSPRQKMTKLELESSTVDSTILNLSPKLSLFFPIKTENSYFHAKDFMNTEIIETIMWAYKVLIIVGKMSRVQLHTCQIVTC